MILAVSSDLIGTSSNCVDKKLEIEGVKNQLKETTGLMKDHKVNATHNPIELRNKQTNLNSQMLSRFRPYDRPLL